jgi:hypothetical protein
MDEELLAVPEAGLAQVRALVEAHGGRPTRDTPRAHGRARQLTWKLLNGGELAWRELHWIGECVIQAIDVPPPLLEALPVRRRAELARSLDAPEPIARIRALRQLVVTAAPFATVSGGLRAMLASPLLEERQAVIGALRYVRWPELAPLIEARLSHEDVLRPQLEALLGAARG